LDGTVFHLGRFLIPDWATQGGYRMQYGHYIKSQLEAALLGTPVVLIEWPRQAGKTALARLPVGDRLHSLTVDDDAELAAARRDPRGFINELAGNGMPGEIQGAPDRSYSPVVTIAAYFSGNLPGRALGTTKPRANGAARRR